ncbi:AAA family ATPase [Asticcacaulis tiandongensis]|uniref:AAA family ATPase n=1 Tax=Asticcacaulis tiandongensis TaxID=2565365 RepID=UPI00112A74B2|nr:AAA family ATPase [Asticcacaulis tiandongensis]
MNANQWSGVPLTGAIPSEADRIGRLAEAGEQMVERLRKTAFLPGSIKQLNVRLGIAEVADLLGCSTNRIRMAEQDGRLPPPPESESGRRLGYDIPALLNMRQVLGASPRRSPEDPPAIITVQNFKGGVGKSTVTTHLAHYLAVQGYRVLVVDCDSQATTTTLFGFNPHFDIRREETLYPYLSIEPTQDDLRYAIKKTIWPNVDLIPSNLQMFDVEYELAAAGSSGGGTLASRFRKLKQGLNDLAQDYDIILLDPPPALGTISLTVMQAANALLVPLAATTPDFCSTVQFLSMMGQVIEQLQEAGIKVEYDFCRLICSKFNANDPSHSMIQRIMEQTFGPALLPVPILESAEISHAALRMMTVYELEKPIGTPKTHKRCRSNIDEAMSQVEQLIRQRWGRNEAARLDSLAV